jgi:hypothetical protein
VSNDTLRINVDPARVDNSADTQALRDWLRSVNRSSKYRWHPGVAAKAGPIGKSLVLARKFQLKATDIGYVGAFALGLRASRHILAARIRRS